MCFALLLYGLYSKITNTQGLYNKEIINYSLNLKDYEKIDDIKIIDKNNVLLVVSDGDQTYLIMYNLEKNRILSKIGK